jgi:hypothetical protein
MGQYYMIVNLDKREFLNPHKLGSGLKLWEMANTCTIAPALLALLACSNGRGGGDFEEDPIIGRWVGDRVVIVGDYAESGDIPGIEHPEIIYALCKPPTEIKDIAEYYRKLAKESEEKEKKDEYQERASLLDASKPYKDISDKLISLVEREADVKFKNKDGWRHFEGKRNEKPAMRPDLVIVGRSSASSKFSNN